MSKCDFCDEPAHADAQMHAGGSWAYFCSSHFSTRTHKGPSTILKKRKTGVQATGDICDGTLISGNMCSSIVTIECNHCGEERRMEPDSETYVCEDCGYTVKYDVMQLTMDGEGTDDDY